MALPLSMAVTAIKTTYSLDAQTVRALEEMARKWKVSKSEALRRAIRLAAEQAASAPESPLQALDALQSALDLDADQAARWEKRARAERRASSRTPGSR
jgi:hypothetical protein